MGGESTHGVRHRDRAGRAYGSGSARRGSGVVGGDPSSAAAGPMATRRDGVIAWRDRAATRRGVVAGVAASDVSAAAAVERSGGAGAIGGRGAWRAGAWPARRRRAVKLA